MQYPRAWGSGARGLGFAIAALALARGAAAGDLVASLPELPRQIESAERGPFVELIRAIDAEYAGQIRIGLFPFVRSVRNVVQGEADFHLPILRDRSVDPASLPYRYASEDLGEVQFVLYSHVDDPLTVERIDAALRSAQDDGQEFPFVIERLRGVSRLGEFPMRHVSDLELGLRRVAARRIHGFVMAQEESDQLVRELRLKEIYRVPYVAFGEGILIAKGPRGDAVDAILSPLIRRLKQSGSWDRLYGAVHGPYDDWQPAQQGW